MRVITAFMFITDVLLQFRGGKRHSVNAVRNPRFPASPGNYDGKETNSTSEVKIGKRCIY